MVNAQEWWLDGKYSQDQKENIRELDLNNQNLEGELDLKDFTNLKILDCSNNQLTSLNLTQNTDLIYLDCSNNQLKELDLTKNEQLTDLNCSNNKLKELIIDKFPDLVTFLCNDNELEGNLKEKLLDHLDSERLICLNISDNNLQGELSDFEAFVNLKFLWVGSENKEKINNGSYNRIEGSLTNLKNLDNLESLEIDNTDIVGSPKEDLPINIKEIHYSSDERPDAGVKNIKEKLRSFESELKEKESVKEYQRQSELRQNLVKEVEKMQKREVIQQSHELITDRFLIPQIRAMEVYFWDKWDNLKRLYK